MCGSLQADIKWFPRYIFLIYMKQLRCKTVYTACLKILYITLLYAHWQMLRIETGKQQPLPALWLQAPGSSACHLLCMSPSQQKSWIDEQELITCKAANIYYLALLEKACANRCLGKFKRNTHKLLSAALKKWELGSRMSKRPSVLLSIFLYSFKVSVPCDYLALRKIIYENAFKLSYILRGQRHCPQLPVNAGTWHQVCATSPWYQRAARLPS